MPPLFQIILLQSGDFPASVSLELIRSEIIKADKKHPRLFARCYLLTYESEFDDDGFLKWASVIKPGSAMGANPNIKLLSQ